MALPCAKSIKAKKAHSHITKLITETLSCTAAFNRSIFKHSECTGDWARQFEANLKPFPRLLLRRAASNTKQGCCCLLNRCPFSVTHKNGTILNCSLKYQNSINLQKCYYKVPFTYRRKEDFLFQALFLNQKISHLKQEGGKKHTQLSTFFSNLCLKCIINITFLPKQIQRYANIQKGLCLIDFIAQTSQKRTSHSFILYILVLKSKTVNGFYQLRKKDCQAQQIPQLLEIKVAF